MYIQEDGIRLHVKLDMPRGHIGKCPLVIIIHGFTGQMEEPHITAVSEMLNGIGCATLRADMYGHGASGGEFRNHTILKWITNALTLIDYALSLDFVTDLYLCGHSQGGLTVMLAAALERERIRGVIPMSPATTIPGRAKSGDLLGVPFDPRHIPDEIVSPDGWVLSGNYIRTARLICVEDAIDCYEGPVLLVHGEEDETIPVQASIDAAKRYRSAELAVIPDETHCYERHLDEVVEAVRRWMLRQLSSSADPS